MTIRRRVKCGRRKRLVAVCGGWPDEFYRWHAWAPGQQECPNSHRPIPYSIRDKVR